MRLKMLLVSLFITFVIVLNAADVKYIFVFVGDGYGENQKIVTEAFIGKKLEMSKLPVITLMGTNDARGKTTDSAASGTALACGVKTNNGMIGITPDGKPVESISEALKKRGFKIAIISSSHLTDATPATHYAHQKSRSMFDQIGEEMAKSGFDFFGGAEVKGKNTLSFLAENGYDVLNGTDSFAKIKKNQKTYVHSQPYTRWNLAEKESNGITLADYTAKAIELLQDNPRGFFMMIENGHTDYAGHSNDSGKMIREALAFDEAVKVAIDFQSKHPDETLVIVTADHETGGLIIKEINQKQIGILNNQTLPVSDANIEIRKLINEKAKPDVIMSAIEKAVGITLTKEEREKIEPAVIKLATTERKNVYGGNVAFVLDAYKMRDQRIGFEYTTGGHSSRKVVTYVKGPGQELFCEPLENSDIPRIIRQIVIPGEAGEYQVERKKSVAFNALLKPFREKGQQTSELSLTTTPYEIREVRFSGQNMKIPLPDVKKIITSIFLKGDGYYLAEITNSSEEQPVLGAFSLSSETAAPSYFVYDPATKSPYLKKDGTKIWTVSELASEFRILLPSKQTVYCLLSDKPVAEFEKATPIQAKSIAKAYQAANKAIPASVKIKTLKGMPAEEDWKNLYPVSFCGPTGETKEKSIVMKAGTDDAHENLFLYFEIPDDKIVAKVPAESPRDSAVYDDDCIELFLGSADSSTYYHIVINSNGAIYDSRKGDTSWNCGFDSKPVVSKDENGWCIKLTIPLKKFDFKTFPLWNACYIDKPTKDISNLSPTGGNFHSIENFIPLELGAE